MTTKGWYVQILWKDISTSWLPMSEVKVENPIELEEYPIYNVLVVETTLKWWVKHTLRHHDLLIIRLKSQRIQKGRIEFGIEIPGTVRMIEMPRFFIIRKYDWFIIQRTSQLQICSK